jgi:hypothetical protein
MRRSDLFGYAGSSHQPQGQVLSAEEEYGYAGSSHQPQGQVLSAEEMYGALGSESLDAEEDYGLDDDDEFGALGSESLDAEEDYGFDEDDDDDDDEFGALGSESLDAEEDYGLDDDDDDDDFGALGSESLSAEEEYGALGSASLDAEEGYGGLLLWDAYFYPRGEKGKQKAKEMVERWDLPLLFKRFWKIERMLGKMRKKEMDRRKPFMSSVQDEWNGQWNSLVLWSSLLSKEIQQRTGHSHKELIDLAKKEHGFPVSYGALGSASLDAEEEYALDDGDEFGLFDDDDDDDDDDYGFDEDDEYGDVDDDDLEATESAIDQDLYGSWYGSMTGPLETKPTLEPYVSGLGQALNIGALLPNALRDGYVESFFEGVEGILEAEAAEEIARYIMQDPRFIDWGPDMNPAIKHDIVQSAIRSTAMPGIELQIDDDLERQFRKAAGNFPELVQNPSFSQAWTLFRENGWNTLANMKTMATTDLPNVVQGILLELPVAGNVLAEAQKKAGLSPADRLYNPLAVRYWAIAQLFGPKIYDWIAQSIDRQGQDAIIAVRADAESPIDLGILNQQIAPIPVTHPTQVIAPSPTGLPRPQTILAVGYSLMCGGAALGLFD